LLLLQEEQYFILEEMEQAARLITDFGDLGFVLSDSALESNSPASMLFLEGRDRGMSKKRNAWQDFV